MDVDDTGDFKLENARSLILSTTSLEQKLGSLCGGLDDLSEIYGFSSSEGLIASIKSGFLLIYRGGDFFFGDFNLKSSRLESPLRSSLPFSVLSLVV